MAAANGKSAPILISGGGIGGLVTAFALARQGLPVRVFEQADEFREVGAGIQLGPNIFAALEKIGLKDAVLADAHVPPAQEMRSAITGDIITNIPLGADFSKRFNGQPYAVTHRADIHATFLKACQSSNLITLETSRRVDGYEDHGEPCQHRPGRRRARRRPRADRLRRHVVENPRAHCRRRQTARLRAHRLSRRAQARTGARGSLASRCRALGRTDMPFRALPAAARRTVQSRRGLPFRPLRRRLECRRQQGAAVQSLQGPAAGSDCACSS